jgi:hypothetical protein
VAEGNLGAKFALEFLVIPSSNNMMGAVCENSPRK